MPQVLIRKTATTKRKSNVSKTHPKLVIKSESGLKIQMPYAPKVVENAGLAPTYTETTRPGRTPLLLRASDPLHTIGLEMFLGHRNAQQSVEPDLAVLRGIVKSDERVTLQFGPSEGGLWRVTTFGWTSTERQNGTNAITRATVSMTFTRVSDATAGTGPVKGGAKPAKGKDKDDSKKKTRGGDGKTPKHYVVKKGDTLSGIAFKFYRDTSKWRKIADVNKIRNPRALAVGKKLVIP